jgi:hypothetical protein
MKTYSAINIQFPISRLILEGKKTIETRTYKIPEKYIGQELLIIETPGKAGDFKSRIVGKITFSSSFKYESKKAFYLDQDRHFVDEYSPWAWREKSKWGWEIESVEVFKNPKSLNKRPGIAFTTNITI